MAAVIGGISVFLEDDSSRFQQSMRRNAALVEQQSQRMARSLGGTAKSVDELSRKASGFQPDAFRALSISALRAQTSIERLRNSMFAIAALAGGGFAGAFGTKVLTDTADAYTNITNRIKAVTEGNRERLEVEKEVFAIAQRTRSLFDASAQLYQRLSQSAKVVKGTQAEILQVVETTQKALVAGGSTVQESASTATQLSQALGAGRLNGDELRSLLENAPILVDAIAKEFGVARGELKQMGQDGQLVSDRVFKAILNAGQDIGDTFSRIQPTVRGSLTVLDNAFTRYIGQADQSLGASAALANGIMGIANNLSTLGNTLMWVSPLLGAFLAQRAVSAIGSRITTPIRDMNAAAQNNVLEARSAAQSASERLVNAGAASASLRSRARTNIDSFADPLHVEDRKSIARELARANADLAKAEAEYQKIADRYSKVDQQLASRDLEKVIGSQAFTALRQEVSKATREVVAAETALARLADPKSQKAQVGLQERINASLEKEDDLRRKLSNAAFQERKRLPEDLTDISQARVTKFTHERETLERQLKAEIASRGDLEARLATESAAHTEKQVRAAEQLTTARQKVVAGEKAIAQEVARTQAQLTSTKLGAVSKDLAPADAARIAAKERILDLQQLDKANEADLAQKAQSNAASQLAQAQKATAVEANNLQRAQLGVARATEAATARSVAMSAAMTGLRTGASGLLSFLGGPFGAAFTAVVAGFGLFTLAQNRAAAAITESKNAVEGLRFALSELNEAVLKNQGLDISKLTQIRAAVQAGGKGADTLAYDLSRRLQGASGAGDIGREGIDSAMFTALRAAGAPLESFGERLQAASGNSRETEAVLNDLIGVLDKLSATRLDLAGPIAELRSIADAGVQAQKNVREAERAATLAAALSGQYDDARDARLRRGPAGDPIDRQVTTMAENAYPGATPDGLAAQSEITKGLYQLEEIANRIRSEPAIDTEWISAEINQRLRDLTTQVLEFKDSLGELPDAQAQIVGEIEAWKRQMQDLAVAYDTAGAAEEAAMRGFQQSGEEIMAGVQKEAEAARSALSAAFDGLDPETLNRALIEVGSSIEQVKKDVDNSATSTEAAKRANDALSAAMAQLSAQGLDFSQPIAALRSLMTAFALTAGVAQNLNLPGMIPNPTLGRTWEQDANAVNNDPVVKEIQGAGEVQRAVADAQKTKTQERIDKTRKELIDSVLGKGGAIPLTMDLDKAVSQIMAGEDARRAEGKKARTGRAPKQTEDEKFADRLERIVEEGRAGFFTDVDRQLIEELKKIKGDPSLMRNTVDAIKNGTALPDQAQQLKDAMLAREAGKEYRGLIDQYGTGEQLASRFAEKQNVLNSLVAQGKITADQANVAYADYISQFGNFAYIDDLASAFEGFGSTIADALFEGELGMETFTKAGRSLAKEIFNIGIQIALLEPLKNLLKTGLSSGASGGGIGDFFSSIIGSLTGTSTAKVNHAGGGASKLGSSRSVPNWMISGAPRFHSGLRANEMLSVLERDEVVMNRSQQGRLAGMVGGLAQMSGGGNMDVQILNQNGSQIGVEKKQGANGKMTARVLVTNMLLDDISQNGEIARALQGLYGMDRMKG